MGDDGDTAYEPWGGGIGEAASPAAARVDTAIRDTRQAVFPLLGLDLWWVLQGVRHPLAWAARVLAFVYAGFYGALDVLAGIATGLMVSRRPPPASRG